MPIVPRQRSEVWSLVWSNREEDLANWNGFEAGFVDFQSYERWVGHVAEVLVERLELGPSDIVADLGCGTGRVAAHIAPRVNAVRAFDYSETVLSIARRRRAHHNITYHHADLKPCPILRSGRVYSRPTPVEVRARF